MIYFIQAEAGGLVKIGLARNLPVRLSQIQIWCPIPLRLLATMDGGAEVERSLHERFHRHRRHGEWFEPDDEIMQLVARHQVEPGWRSARRRKTPTLTTITCKWVFYRWATEFADSRSISVADLVVLAAERYSIANGYEAPPPAPSVPWKGKTRIYAPQHTDGNYPLIFKTDPGWRGWLNGFSEHLRTNNSRVVRQALVDHGLESYPVEAPSFLSAWPKTT